MCKWHEDITSALSRGCTLLQGVWQDAWVDCFLKLAAPIGLWPITPVLSKSPFRRQRCPSASDHPIPWIYCLPIPPTHPSFPWRGCANGAPVLSLFHCSVLGPHCCGLGGGEGGSASAPLAARRPTKQTFTPHPLLCPGSPGHALFTVALPPGPQVQAKVERLFDSKDLCQLVSREGTNLIFNVSRQAEPELQAVLKMLEEQSANCMQVQPEQPCLIREWRLEHTSLEEVSSPCPPVAYIQGPSGTAVRTCQRVQDAIPIPGMGAHCSTVSP